MNEENKKRIEEYKENIKDIQEFELFLCIHDIGGMIWRHRHEFFHGRLLISEENYENTLEYLNKVQEVNISILPNFSVDPKSVEDRKNGEYWKWYTFWKEWMDSFSDEKWAKFGKAMKKKENLTKFLPKEKWNKELKIKEKNE